MIQTNKSIDKIRNSLSDTPMLIIAFNRPDLLRDLLQNLKRNNVNNLYIHLDGPRRNSKTDYELVEACYYEILTGDWGDSVKILRQESNLGCKLSVIAAINWAFQFEKELIILEDDIQVSSEFIDFCKYNLEKFENNDSIMAICGYNFLINEETKEKYSSTLSSYPALWGWAIWKEKWNKYYISEFKLEIKLLLGIIKSNNYNVILIIFYVYNLYLIENRKIDTWDYQMYFSAILQDKKFILPSKSLSSNIGFREDATHTKQAIRPLLDNIKIKSFKVGNYDESFRRFYSKLIRILLYQKIIKIIRK
jgi:hypothetical protein